MSCNSDYSVSGAGGYVSGEIRFDRYTTAFLTIGGMGILSPPSSNAIGLGGYNGGGYCKSTNDGYSAASGGGATDLRLFQNDLIHRILVAGGGGGSDNQDHKSDGRGGAGGEETAQGYQNGDNFETEKVATQENGWFFGFGENGNWSDNGDGTNDGEAAGAGGGWYGWFASHNHDMGAGGSSFALEKRTKKLPEDYPLNVAKYYFNNVEHEQGVRGGNGLAIIRIIQQISPMTPTVSKIVKKSDNLFNS